MADGLVDRSPDVMSGQAVFSGTRVPIRTLFDCLQAGERLDDFLADFPTVRREQAVGLLVKMRDIAASVA
ncbi:MAG TPA: DUF433 domain-containing protein [Chloroflexota bacterium]